MANALARSLAVGAVLLPLAASVGCGGRPEVAKLHPGTTVTGTLVDRDGNGVLESGPGARLVERTDLAAGAPVARTLVTLAQISDPHIVDEESPLRVEVVDRVGDPVSSAFRPQETLTTQVLEAAVLSVNRLAPDVVLVTGDLADSSQMNELDWALTGLSGGNLAPDSGAPGYEGVQTAVNGDPFFYRPDLDAPRHAGLLTSAQAPFRATGLDAPWLPAISNHDVLVQGVVPTSAALAKEAVGGRKLERPSARVRELARAGSLDRAVLERLLVTGDLGRFRAVAADARRRPVGAGAVEIIARAAQVPTRNGHLTYHRQLAPGVRLVVLDTANRAGGSDGVVSAWQRAWLKTTLRAHSQDRILVVAPTPLEDTAGGAAALAIIDRAPAVVAVLSGDTHRNRITPRRSPSGGYWLVRAPSLIDFPQQVRALRLVELTDGRVALETWLIDHAGAPDRPGTLGLAGISRDLAFLDTQGGRPKGWSGEAADRNAVLYVPR